MAIASLTAMLLLSCNSVENSSSAEDLDFSQTPTLQKGSVPIDPYAVPPPTPAGTGSYTVNGSGSMKVSSVPYGNYAWSSQVCYDFTRLSSLYTNPKNSSYEFTCSVPTNAVGAFGITHAEVVCDGVTLQGTWQGFSGTMTTNYFSGQSAAVRCCTRFYGRCNGTGSGGVGCTYEMKNCTGLQYFTY